MAKVGHYQGAGGTRQGIYVCTPNGRMLKSCNSLNADTVLAMMKEGLAAWEQSDETEGQLTDEDAMQSDPRWEWRFPEEGLVLRSTQRDLPTSGSPLDERLPRFNADHVWIQKDEARGFLPEDLTIGATRTVSNLLTERLARFHVVDNVRGQTLPFSPREVAASKLASEITAIDEDLVSLQVTGTLRANSDGIWDMGDNIWKPNGEWPRSIETQVLGRATYSTSEERFKSFELLALGERTGRTQLNGRRDEFGTIGFSFVLAGDSPSDRVAPGFIHVYDAPWIEPIADTGSR
ncbi:MAG: hypothetical protein ACI8TQ_003317 [Planctomycetota bacterium]|jgi:hypothetical protein